MLNFGRKQGQKVVIVDTLTGETIEIHVKSAPCKITLGIDAARRFQINYTPEHQRSVIHAQDRAKRNGAHK